MTASSETTTNKQNTIKTNETLLGRQKGGKDIFNISLRFIINQGIDRVPIITGNKGWRELPGLGNKSPVRHSDRVIC